MAKGEKELKTDQKQVYKVYTKSGDPEDNDRLEFLKILDQCNGLVSFACEKFGISRQAYYKWLDDDWFKEAVEEINSGPVTDRVESKMFEKINGVKIQKGVSIQDDEIVPAIYDIPPSDRMIEFFLKSRASKKGYGDKTDITSGGEKISSQIIINLTDKDDESDPM